MTIETGEKIFGVAELMARKLKYASYSVDYRLQLSEAFVFGLWYRDIPEWMFDGISRMSDWSLKSDEREDLVKQGFEIDHLYRFHVVADTADSWHSAYRDIRSKGWARLVVRRSGGELRYIMGKVDNSKPDGYRSIFLCFDITLSTCRQVQVGFEQVPRFETVCDDVAEPVEYEGQVDSIVELKDGTVVAEDFKLPSSTPAELQRGDSDILF